MDDLDVVTPLAGVWIEITEHEAQLSALQSLPLRECGLKSSSIPGSHYRYPVTPLAGVWIEITYPIYFAAIRTVTPLAGVWIEIPTQDNSGPVTMSLPLRECGLKCI